MPPQLSPHQLLTYELVADYLGRRPQYREEHLRLAGEARARGELVMAGAAGEPPDIAVLVFRGEDAAIAEEFARADPYVVNGLVKSWRVRPWRVVDWSIAGE